MIYGKACSQVTQYASHTSGVKALDSTLHGQPRKYFFIISGAESAYGDDNLYVTHANSYCLLSIALNPGSLPEGKLGFGS